MGASAEDAASPGARRVRKPRHTPPTNQPTSKRPQTHSRGHPSCHYAQTLWMPRKKTPRLAKKVCKLLLFKNVYKCYFFSSCKIRRFIVIYRCKLRCTLTFLSRAAWVNDRRTHAHRHGAEAALPAPCAARISSQTPRVPCRPIRLVHFLCTFWLYASSFNFLYRHFILNFCVYNVKPRFLNKI